MTREEKVLAATMRIDGSSLYEIADKVGIRPNSVEQFFIGLAARKQTAPSAIIIYDNIIEWMRNTGRREKWLALQADINERVLYEVLRGDRKMTKDILVKLSAVTGLDSGALLHRREESVPRGVPLKNVIYPNIRDWLIGNKRSIKQMAADIGRSYGSIYDCITTLNRTAYLSERIAAYVGMTEEKAFYREPLD